MQVSWPAITHAVFVAAFDVFFWAIGRNWLEKQEKKEDYKENSDTFFFCIHSCVWLTKRHKNYVFA